MPSAAFATGPQELSQFFPWHGQLLQRLLLSMCCFRVCARRAVGISGMTSVALNACPLLMVMSPASVRADDVSVQRWRMCPHVCGFEPLAVVCGVWSGCSTYSSGCHFAPVPVCLLCCETAGVYERGASPPRCGPVLSVVAQDCVWAQHSPMAVCSGCRYVLQCCVADARRNLTAVSPTAMLSRALCCRAGPYAAQVL